MGIVRLHQYPTTLPPKELPLLKDLGFVKSEVEENKYNSKNAPNSSSEDSSDGSFDLYAYNPPSDSDEQDRPTESPQEVNENDERKSKEAQDVDQLISFLSRVKYLYKDMESMEAVPVTVPVGAKMVDQRSIMKQQAEKVRNQLELKFRAIPLAMQADKFIEGHKSIEQRGLYNPLQTIRNRRYREVSGKRFRRVNIWQIPVSEMVEDIKWQFQNMKRRSQLGRRRESGSSRNRQFSQSTDPVAKCRSRKLRSHSCNNQNSRRDSIMQRVPSYLVNKNDGLQLLDRLKSSHAENEVFIDDDDDDDNNDEMPNTYLPVPMNISHFKTLSPFSVPSMPDLNAKRKHRPTFCRNKAHIEESWNKMHNHSSSISSQSALSDSGDHLLAPSLNKKLSNASFVGSTSDGESIRKWHTSDSRGLGGPLSSNGNATSSSAGPYLAPNPGTVGTVGTVGTTGTTGTSGSVGSLGYGLNTNTLGSSGSAGSNTLNTPFATANSNDFPSLTVTNDHGHIMQIETERVQNVAKLKEEYMNRQAFDKFVNNANGNTKAADIVVDKAKICPSKTCNAVFRTPLCENYMELLETDLDYLMILYKRGITRHGILTMLAQKRLSAPEPQPPNLSIEFKNERVPNFLEYITSVESKVSQMNHQIETEVLSTVDGLRVATDVVVSEVNTSLNKELRDLTSRVEKLYSKCNTNITKVIAYRALEYLVVLSLWIIWGAVKLWKLALVCLHLFRAVLFLGN